MPRDLKTNRQPSDNTCDFATTQLLHPVRQRLLTRAPSVGNEVEAKLIDLFGRRRADQSLRRLEEREKCLLNTLARRLVRGEEDTEIIARLGTYRGIFLPVGAGATQPIIFTQGPNRFVIVGAAEGKLLRDVMVEY